MKESNMQKYVVMIKDGGKWEEYARLKDKILAETVLKLVSKDFPAKIIELKWAKEYLFLWQRPQV